jgi:hypothetical protein
MDQGTMGNRPKNKDRDRMGQDPVRYTASLRITKEL